MARNITRNRVTLEGNTVPTSIRHTTFKGGGSVINLTLVTQTEVWGMVEGKMSIVDTKPEYHSIVIKGGSKALHDILKPKSLFVRVEGELRYRKWTRELKDIGAEIEQTQAEIVVAGPKSEFYIFPCVNRQGGAEPAPAAADPGPGPFSGSEQMDDLPW